MYPLIFVIFSCCTLLTTISAEATEICEHDEVFFNGSCYWSSFEMASRIYGSYEADWFAAQLMCQKRKSTLAYFEDGHDLMEKQLILAMSGCTTSWLGLVWASTLSDQAWVWWNQPDHYNNTIDGREPSCNGHVPSAARLITGTGLSGAQVYADFPDKKVPFVCKREALSGNATDACSVPGFQPLDTTCCPKMPEKFHSIWFYDSSSSLCYTMPHLEHNFGSNVVDYFAAQMTCQESDMHLVSVHSDEQNTVVGLAALCTDVWIGLENIRDVNNQLVCNCDGWAWEDGTSRNHIDNSLCGDFDNNWFNYTNSAQLKCDINQQCGFLKPGYKVQQKIDNNWENDYCSTRRNFLCVAPATNKPQ